VSFHDAPEFREEKEHGDQDVWKKQYIKHLDEPIGRFLSGSKLLEEFNKWTRGDDGPNLSLGTHLVWKEHETGEKDRVIEAINSLVADPMILSKLELLEVSKRTLAASISDIAKEATKLSKAIEADAYTAKLDCCYNLAPRLIRYLVR
jgi:hypothetical protein